MRKLIVDISDDSFGRIRRGDLKDDDILLRIGFDFGRVDYAYTFTIGSNKPYNLHGGEIGVDHDYVDGRFKVAPSKGVSFEQGLDDLISCIERENEVEVNLIEAIKKGHGAELILRTVRTPLNLHYNKGDMGLETEKRKIQVYGKFITTGLNGKGMDRFDLLFLLKEGLHDMTRLEVAREEIHSIDVTLAQTEYRLKEFSSKHS